MPSYNEHGIQIYSLEEIDSLLASKIILQEKKVSQNNKKLEQKKKVFESEFDRGYLQALKDIKRETSRKNWKLGKDYEFKDTIKGKIFKYIDDNVIPELPKEDLDVIYFLKDKMNEIYSA